MQHRRPHTTASNDIFAFRKDDGEWIVGSSGSERRLHVYRLAPDDWLISEVGLGNEGRGMDPASALAELSRAVAPAGWWSGAAEALNSLQDGLRI